jgi:hypothetical protein
MRRKSATLGRPAPADATSEKKPAVASPVAEPATKGQAVSEDAIRLCAYQKWEAAGKPEGDGIQFWREAEQELLPAN